MTFSLEGADFALRLLQIVFIPLLAWVWRSAAALQRDQLAIRVRLSTLEAQLASVPSAQSLHELSLSVERMSGNLKALGERMGGIDRVVDRVDKMVTRQETYLLNGVGK